MPDVGAIVDHLKKAHAEFVAACKEIPESRWRSNPGNGSWSGADVVVHLIQVEDAVTTGAKKLLREPPKPVPIWKRLHLPIVLAQSRGFKVKSPIPLDTSMVKDREEMLANLTGRRDQTVALLLSNARADLSAYRMPHPFFGSLNFYSWFRLLGHHQTRHAKQIREIAKSLRQEVPR